MMQSVQTSILLICSYFKGKSHKKNILNRILLHPLAVLQITVNEKLISDLDIFIKENLNKALIYLYAVLS